MLDPNSDPDMDLMLRMMPDPDTNTIIGIHLTAENSLATETNLTGTVLLAMNYLFQTP
jgi:hypothetical protein